MGYIRFQLMRIIDLVKPSVPIVGLNDRLSNVVSDLSKERLFKKETK